MSELLNYPLTGRVVVEASAGTGKTFTLTHLFLRILLETPLTIDKILVVTFTEAATQELHARIRRQLKNALKAIESKTNDKILQAIIDQATCNVQDKITIALQHIDQAQISTIHSFCQTALQSHTFQSGASFGAELIANQDALVESAIHAFWRQTMYRSSEGFINFALSTGKLSLKRLTEMVSFHLGKTHLEILPPKPSIFAEMEEQYHKWKANYPELREIWQENKEQLFEWVKPIAKFRSNSKDPKEMDSYFFWEQPGMDVPKDSFKKYLQPALFESDRHPFFPKAHAFYQAFIELDQAYQEQLLCLYHGCFEYVEGRLKQMKQSLNKLSFNDLLLNLHTALKSESGKTLANSLCKRHPVALIDEFQDTDPIQFEIFDTIYAQPCEHSVVYFIGDPKQSIYRFRGADIFTYKRATEHEEQKSLMTNWRSQKGVLKAIETLFTHTDRPFQLDDDTLPAIKFQSVQHAEPVQEKQLLLNGQPFIPMTLWNISGREKTQEAVTQEVTQGTAYEISRLLKLGRTGELMLDNQPVEPQDITVIVRKNKQAIMIQDALKPFNIPSVVYSDRRVFDSWEALEFLNILMAIQTPGNDRQLKAALTTDMLSFTGVQLFELMKHESHWENQLDKFRQYHTLWLEQGFIPMWQKLLDENHVFENVSKFANADRRITNIRQLSTLLYERSQYTHMGMSGLIAWLKQQRLLPSKGDEAEHEELATDRNAVKILTIHRSKGLEFSIVFCPFLWDGSIKYPYVIDVYDPDKKQLVLYIGNNKAEYDNYKNTYSKQIQAEDIRLAYVALTRTRYACYLSWCWKNKNGCGWSPLAYLLGFYKENWTDEQVLQVLEDMAERSQGCIQIGSPPTEGIPYTLPPAKETALREFTQNLYSTWRMTSYSALSASSHSSYEPKDHDEIEDAVMEVPEADILDIFHFPRGSQVGDFFHLLLEHCQFQWGSPKIREYVREQCIQFHYEEKWVDTLTQMLVNTLTTPLRHEKPEMSLAKVSPEKYLAEMAFLFPLTSIYADGIQELFRKHSKYTLEGLSFKTVKGMMKGFVDLIFEYDGQYYVSDYKSNHLGHQIEDYHKDKLEPIMIKTQYIWQYHIYTVALHRYLQLRLPDYSYEKHMGGVLYLFLRGMNPQMGPDYGIFYDKPSAELIDRLSEYLTQVAV